MDQRVSVTYSEAGRVLVEATSEVVTPPTRGRHDRLDPEVWPPYLASREPAPYVLTTVQEADPHATVSVQREKWLDGADPAVDDPVALETVELPAPPKRTRTMVKLEGAFDPGAEITRLGRLFRKAYAGGHDEAPE